MKNSIALHAGSNRQMQYTVYDPWITRVDDCWRESMNVLRRKKNSITGCPLPNSPIISSHHKVNLGIFGRSYDQCRTRSEQEMPEFLSCSHFVSWGREKLDPVDWRLISMIEAPCKERSNKNERVFRSYSFNCKKWFQFSKVKFNVATARRQKVHYFGIANCRSTWHLNISRRRDFCLPTSYRNT